MKKYETMIILNVNLEEEARKAALEGLLDVLKTNGAEKIEVNEWGSREFAYEIEKQTRGYYVVLTYETNNMLLNKEFERICGINQNVVRHMTIAL
ncbi:MAG: 30S ribosomal protein S6 [Bacilli bacterium]|jgi:small subunit ribosomal protein S6|nr:30S ribosomal protein S6 [Bacilli bacterium]MDD4584934.1 30S ribosomal protein S6 [Bacilli bacterium]